MTQKFETPVAIFIFNRPSTTNQVFERIKAVKPRHLILIADGPRDKDEKDLCNECIRIVENINWDCQVKRNYSENNLGVVKRYISALDWIYSIYEEAIILDDDCLPDLSFFPYCEEMLRLYRSNEKIMLVSGQTMTSPDQFSEYSYYFSRFALIWGWATWRNSWKRFSIGMNLWPYLRNTNWLSNIIQDPTLREYWRKSFDRAYEGCVKTWDYQWMFVFFLYNGLSVVPNRNLISNIGFGPTAVNTKDPLSENANLPTFPIEFPLIHPQSIFSNSLADKIIAEKLWISRYRKNNFIVTDGIKEYN